MSLPRTPREPPLSLWSRRRRPMEMASRPGQPRPAPLGSPRPHHGDAHRGHKETWDDHHFTTSSSSSYRILIVNPPTIDGMPTLSLRTRCHDRPLGCGQCERCGCLGLRGCVDRCAASGEIGIPVWQLSGKRRVRLSVLIIDLVPLENGYGRWKEREIEQYNPTSRSLCPEAGVIL